MTDKTQGSFAAAPKRWEVIVTFAGTALIAAVAVPWYGWYHGFDGFLWAIFGLFAALNNLSITTGYHRLWSHRTFRANIVVRALLALGGAFALQNSVLKWASDHRRHHRFVDDPDTDPYAAKRGFWFSHMGWMLRDYPSAPLDFSNVKDLMRDPIVRFQHRYYLRLGVALNLGIPLVIGAVHGDIVGALILVGVLRLVVCHQTTFLINSLAHMWGTQPYSKENTARDNPVLAVLTFGEGYHNFHHAFPGDYRNGIRWWQWDPTKWLIRALWTVGLIRDLRTTRSERVAERVAAQRNTAGIFAPIAGPVQEQMGEICLKACSSVPTDERLPRRNPNSPTCACLQTSSRFLTTQQGMADR
jgi:stearoyl-CoA desaturase (Delta-9 desaturase)